MSRQNLQNTDPRLLMRVMSTPEQHEAWAAADMAAMVRHQLAAPLAGDLELAFPGSGARVAALAQAARPAVVSFVDLLGHAAPPVELLALVKQMAKLAGEDGGTLPQEVASYFYFASIAAARRAGASISTLSPERLRAGLTWLLGQPWLDGAPRQILQRLAEGI